MDDRTYRAQISPEARIGEELRATLAASRELGPDYEPQVIEAFLDRIRPVLRAPVPEVSRAPSRRGRHGSGRGLFLAAMIVFGWMLLGHFNPALHHSHRYYVGIGSTAPPPNIAAPVPPALPQQPGSSVQ